MAVKRKAEGIALLSLYNDDEEDFEEEEEEEEEAGKAAEENAAMASTSPDATALPACEVSPRFEAANNEEGAAVITLAASVELDPGLQTNDEVLAAASEAPVSTSVDVNVDEEQQPITAEENGVLADADETDSLSDFLPPPPSTKCSQELQSKITKYLAYKNAGRSFNEELRNSKGYRNPDFLQHAVKYREIDQIGSCFKKEVFDPHGYDDSDFYDAISLQQKRETERKEQERKQSQRVEFVRSGIQTSATITALVQKSSTIQVACGVTAADNPVTTVVKTTSEGRVKKSKWDKVENDNSRVMSMSTMNAIASVNALMGSTTAGAGYTLFAQQKRKEAEDKCKGDKGFHNSSR